ARRSPPGGQPSPAGAVVEVVVDPPPGPCDTTIPTLVPTSTTVPGGTLWLITEPAGTVGLLAKVTCGLSPRLVSWDSAVAWVWFTTLGTSTVSIGGGPSETTIVTTDPRGVSVP